MKILRNALIPLTFFLLLNSTAQASESDIWTYANIPLEDSAPKILKVLEHYLIQVQHKTNSELQSLIQTQAIESITPTVIENLFFKIYTHDLIKAKILQGSSSNFETCINKKNSKRDPKVCPPEIWPEFERIVLLPGESIYDKANYTVVSKKALSSVINACDIRMGTDKVTHFINDALGLYNGTRDSRFHYNLEQVTEVSHVLEKHFFGLKGSAVYSKADILANVQGVKFYQNFFQGDQPLFIIVKNSNSVSIIKNKMLDICSYFISGFDERVALNSYLPIPKEKYWLEESSTKHGVEDVPYNNLHIIQKIKQRNAALEREIYLAQKNSRHSPPSLELQKQILNREESGREVNVASIALNYIFIERLHYQTTEEINKIYNKASPLILDFEDYTYQIEYRLPLKLNYNPSQVSSGT